MLCKQCGSELREGASFCVKCGKKIEPETVSQAVAPQNENVCTNCGTPLEAGARFCISCGTPTMNAQPVPNQIPQKTVNTATMPNQNAVPPVIANPAMPVSIQKETFQFTYLGGGKALSFIFGNPLYLTVDTNQVTLTHISTYGSYATDIPCNEIVGFELKRKLNIVILLLGLFILVLGILFAIEESLYSILWIVIGIGILLNLFPTELTIRVSDGRKFGNLLKKPKPEQMDAVNRLCAMMDTIVHSQPKVTGITKKQSQIKRHKK